MKQLDLNFDKKPIAEPTKLTAQPPIQQPWFYDTKEGIDYFVDLAISENPKKLDSKEIKEIKDLGNDMKKSAYEDHAKSLKQFRNDDPKSYPSNPLQRGKLLEMGKLEADLKANNINYNPKYNAKKPPVKKRNYWDATVELNKGNKGDLKLPTLTAEEKIRVKQPTDWEIIYGSMTPFEKGQWNAEQRKKKLDNIKTTEKIYSTPLIDESIINRPISKPEPQIPLREQIKILADQRLFREQRAWDREHGRDGITNVLRPK